MKVRLLHPDSDVSLDPRLPRGMARMVEDDLELLRVYKVMADGDDFIREVVQQVILHGGTSPEVMLYRQDVLADCLANLAAVQEFYGIAVDGAEVRRKIFLGGLMTRDPVTILHRAVEMLELLVSTLRQVRRFVDVHHDHFQSSGFGQLFAMMSVQLSNDYLARLNDDLAELALPRGELLSARLSLGNKGIEHTLHVAPQRNWWDKLTGSHQGGYGFEVEPRDQAGSQALGELAGRAINDVANTVMQSADHVQTFFARLRVELGFYLGCANLHGALTSRGVPTCFPLPGAAGEIHFRCHDLRDVGLCLTTRNRTFGNDIHADGKSLIVVTGANEGGKSTFLRSVGTAQMMMQAGMFVTAESFRADIRTNVLTHFKREEDASMTHGKLDEELARMAEVADHVETGSLLLFNESFASTNEREGSQIAGGVIDALVEAGVKVAFVTHLYALAHGLYERADTGQIFLRAERRSDGSRSYRLSEGEPEPTSYGADSFQRVFGAFLNARSGLRP